MQPFAWPPSGHSVRCPVTRDTFVSAYKGEKDGSNGGGSRLKAKGNQEFILFDIDPNALKGKVITGALLHLRSASPEKAPLARLGVSSVASEWREGKSRNYHPEQGGACFSQAEFKNRDWAYSGSSIMDAAFGRGHTIWRFADCTAPDKGGWQKCAVDPDVVAARAAGLSHGFLVSDEVGSEWSLRGGKFDYVNFPNRFCYSRESRGGAPWLEVWVNGEDSIPPEPVSDIKVVTESLPAGQALLSWKTPSDHGGGRTLGFEVYYRKDGKEHEVPRYLIPMAAEAGEKVLMHLQDLPFGPGAKIQLIIRPIDSAGNVGPPIEETIRLASLAPSIDLPGMDMEPFPFSKELPSVAGVKVSVLDMLDKVDPRTGEMIPAQKEGYKGGNHIYSAKLRRIRLQSARNEHVLFQLNLEGRAQEISLKYIFDGCPDLKPRVYQCAYVMGKDKDYILPDPLIPLERPFSIPSSDSELHFPNQRNHSLICELYVPHQEEPGVKKGRLSVMASGGRLDLDIELTVWNFTLPDKLSFVPEMNAYGTATPYKGYEYYRLAHEHRSCLNRLPYGWNGKPEFAPAWTGKGFDWAEWDAKVGPLLDGSAFKDLPRKGEPVDILYLPFNENWPVSVFEHYSPSYWADEAFDCAYVEDLKSAFAAFARHCTDQGWNQTAFEFYLNNKVYHRKEYDKCSAPWVFDEPVNTQDFWALRLYGLLWNEAVAPVRGDVTMWFRADISYTEFSRNILWGVTDIEYLGGNNDQKTRMKQDEFILGRKAHFAEYGTANRIDHPNTQPVLWCLSAWSRGASDVLPWQTIGSKECWRRAEQTALFYPHPEGPMPSVRLKAFRRGQQDVEYLTLLCEVSGWWRDEVGAWLRKKIKLQDSYSKADANDASTASFGHISPMDLWKLRYQVGKFLSEKAPAYRRALIKRGQSKWHPRTLPDIGYVRVAPKVNSLRPDCDNFKPFIE